ncbi:unnamed protein product, partial [Dicrocoelium dendriticum]
MVEGNPSPKIQWMVSGGGGMGNEARYGTAIRAPRGSVFRITNVLPQYNGNVITCTATNALGRAEHSAKLTVLGNEAATPPGFPQFLNSFSVIVAKKNSGVELECRTSGSPPPVVTWYKDSVPVDTGNPRFTQLQDGNLKIANLVEDDEGKYECAATNDKGTRVSSGDNLLVRENVEASLQLIAPSTKRFRPHFTKVPPARQIVPPGGRLALTCTAVGAPAPRVDWYHANRRLVHEQAEQNTPGSARILLLDLSESINVTCVAVSSMGRVHHEVQVIVKTLPQPPGQPSLVDVGSTFARLAFTPTPSQPIWKYLLFWIETKYYNDRMLQIMPHKAASLLNTSNLYEEPPAGWTNAVQPDVLLLPNDPKNATKNADGYVRILDTTELSKALVDSSNMFQTIDASLTRLKPYTNYTVWARAVGPEADPSNAGPTWTFITHEVAPTSPPTEVHAEAISNAAVTVYWNPPADPNGRIRAYRILYTDRPNLEVAFWDTSIVDMDSNRAPSLASQSSSMSVTSGRHRPTHVHILSHLTVNATYFIRVSAVNGKGEGPPSEPVVVIVRPGLLPAPSNLTAAATSFSEIELKWTPPDNLEQNSRLLQHYQIQYAPMSTIAATATTSINSSLLHWTASLDSLTSDSVNTKIIGAHLNTMMISDLKPDQLYIIAIATVSQAGPGVRNAVFCRTKKFVPPQPANLTVQAVGPTELFVQWQSPIPDNPDRTTAAIAGRIAYFELTWRPSNKDGGWIRSEQHRTSSDWTTPSIAVSEIQGSELQPISRRLVPAQTDSTTSGWYKASIGALQPSTFYVIHVRAVASSGSGDRAMSTPVQTWDPPLPAPKNLRLLSQVFPPKTYSTFPQVSIKVSWEPLQGATEIVTYRIRWRMLLSALAPHPSDDTSSPRENRRIRSGVDHGDITAERWIYWPDPTEDCHAPLEMIPCRLQLDEVNTTETNWISIPGHFLLSMTYEFRVAALTTVQAGHEAIQLIALEGAAPTGTPTDLRVKHEMDSFILSWGPPDWSHRHGPFGSYEVLCDSTQPMKSINVTMYNSQVEWHGNHKGTPNSLIAWPNGRIRVQSVWQFASVTRDSTCAVRGRTKYGDGPWSSRVVIYAKQQRGAPPPPKKINALALRGAQLRISWAMPLELVQTLTSQQRMVNASMTPSQLIYRRFAVYVRPPDQQNWTRYLTNGPVTEFIVHERGVFNYVGYVVRVSSVGANGHEGTWSDAVNVRSTATGAPAKLYNLTCLPMYMDQNQRWTLQISWRTPDQLLVFHSDSGRLMHYRVNYTDAAIPTALQSRESSIRVLQPKSLVEHQIDNLESNKVYWISVRPVIAPSSGADPTQPIDVYGVPIHSRCATPQRAQLQLKPPTIVQTDVTHPGQGVVVVACATPTEQHTPVTVSLVAKQLEDNTAETNILVQWTASRKPETRSNPRYLVYLSELEARHISDDSDHLLSGLRLSQRMKYALALRACFKTDPDSYSLLAVTFGSQLVCQQSLWVQPVATDLPPPPLPLAPAVGQKIGVDPDRDLWFSETSDPLRNQPPSDDAAARGPGFPIHHSKRQSVASPQSDLLEYGVSSDIETGRLSLLDNGRSEGKIKAASMSILISMICLGILLFASGLLCLLYIMYRRRGWEFVQGESKQWSDGSRRSRWTTIPAHALFGWIRLNKHSARRRARSAFTFSEMHGPPPGSCSVTANLPPYETGFMIPLCNEAASTGFGCDSIGGVPRPNGTLRSYTGSVDAVCNTPQFGSLRKDVLRIKELVRVNTTELTGGAFYGSQPGALCPIDSFSLGTGPLETPSLSSGYALHPICNAGLGSGSVQSDHISGPKLLSGLGLSCANPMVTGPQSRRTGDSHLIPVDQLVEYVRSLKADNGRLMAAEFESIDAGGQFTWEHSNRSMNRPKNRYANVIAYDHSRVVLQSTSPLDPDSDYINANYLDGYQKQNAYIATQ